jgi:hypothetical protein
MIVKNLPVSCPACHSQLTVKSLACTTCDTVIDGLFDLPLLAQLDKKDQEFILSFVKHSGSLKEMAKEMGLSYPTVRNFLDTLIANIKTLETKKPTE